MTTSAAVGDRLAERLQVEQRRPLRAFGTRRLERVHAGAGRRACVARPGFELGERHRTAQHGVARADGDRATAMTEFAHFTCCICAAPERSRTNLALRSQLRLPATAQEPLAFELPAAPQVAEQRRR